MRLSRIRQALGASLSNNSRHQSIRAQIPLITSCLIGALISCGLLTACATTLDDYVPRQSEANNVDLYKAALLAERYAKRSTNVVLFNPGLFGTRIGAEILTEFSIDTDGKTIGMTFQDRNSSNATSCKYTFADPSSFGVRYFNHGAAMQTSKANPYFSSDDSTCPFIADIYWESANDARSFVDAIFALASAPPGAYQNAAAMYNEKRAQFDSVAIQYRRQNPKPELPIDAQRYLTQANDAVSRDQKARAIELYQKALDAAAWWPAGHYNLALLMGEQQDYDDAIDEMKKYLELVPDAPDAQKAQQQIWIWQGREQTKQ